MCGIIGIYSKDSVARKIFFAMLALQHRGQESAGIAVSTGLTINYKKDDGMVNQIFREEHLQDLTGTFGIGHVRYSTTKIRVGGKQPYYFASKLGPFAIAHNGQISNYETTKKKLLNDGVCFFTESDSELLAHYLARSKATNWLEALRQLVNDVPGAYSLLVLTNDGIYGVRDRLGLRLLVLGTDGAGEHHLASESCCFGVNNIHDYRDVAPGTVVHLSATGCKEHHIVTNTVPKVCAFEHVYFARPDSEINGVYVNETRQRIGRELWNIVEPLKLFRAAGDYVVAPVPESANPVAIGFSTASGIRYNEIFAKNRYIHRTFIKPVDTDRKSAVDLKFNPLVNNIRGKRIILVDDSIVRGNTIRRLVKIVRQAGATEIHVLVGSPPIHYPCYMGIDMKCTSEFAMDRFSTATDLAKSVGADSITFLTIEGLYTALGGYNHCTACWTGKYPKELEW